jgi:hypothetical protein
MKEEFLVQRGVCKYKGEKTWSSLQRGHVPRPMDNMFFGEFFGNQMTTHPFPFWSFLAIHAYICGPQLGKSLCAYLSYS